MRYTLVEISINKYMKYEAFVPNDYPVASAETFCEILEALDGRYGNKYRIDWPTGDRLKTINRMLYLNDHSLEINGIIYEDCNALETCTNLKKEEIV